MTTLQEARSETNTLFHTAWGGVGSEITPIFWDNIPGDGEEPDEYVIAQFQSSAGEIQALGPTEFVQRGIFIAQIFTPSDKGSLRNDTLVQTAINAFQSAPPGSVRYLNPSIIHVGNDGKFFQTNISVEFEYRHFV